LIEVGQKMANMDTGEPISANAYLCARPVAQALDEQALFISAAG